MDMDKLKFDEKGLIPAIVQDYYSKQVLTVAYMNREALETTIREGKTCFYSRSRQQLWRKGETSGNTQKGRSGSGSDKEGASLPYGSRELFLQYGVCGGG